MNKGKDGHKWPSKVEWWSKPPQTTANTVGQWRHGCHLTVLGELCRVDKVGHDSTAPPLRY